MKSFVAFALFLAVGAAIPVQQDKEAVVLRFDNNNIGVEGYNYGVETSNGIQTQEEGVLTNVGTENEALEVRGQFSYTGDDGILYTVTYQAGRDGFIASGAHIPKNPQ
ncbi:unnamed protein product [Leptosia nina]|uniref:Uncharacterized protein n=1 Tax=Leptosia nina TaxID=320188 RepID=A0AAV1IZZ7_9NEOP